MGDEEIREVKEFLHKIDKALAEARTEVHRLMSDVKQDRQDTAAIKQEVSKLQSTVAAFVASQETQDTMIETVEKDVERHETRSDRLLWGMIVGMGMLLLSIIGLVLNAVFP